jgi:hypothetical protein
MIVDLTRSLESDDAASAAFHRTTAALDRAAGAARGESIGPRPMDVAAELRSSLLLLVGVLAPIVLLALLLA